MEFRLPTVVSSEGVGMPISFHMKEKKNYLSEEF
jgi:hypothetical protein